MSEFMTPAQIQQFGPPTLANLEHVWEVARITAAFNYASVTIMLWDMLLTMQMEVRLLWRTKISFLKAAFLVNRYVSPTFICVNIYFLSGRATLTDEARTFTPRLSITDSFVAVGFKRVLRSLATDRVSHSCRGWFSVAALVQIFCLGSISFLFAFRLWAWYEVSARVLYALLFVWASSLICTLALVIDLGIHTQDITHDSFLNICITTAPVIWPQWLPATVEHGVYAVFLLFNAMATPRSERKAALAIIYRDGIVFYMLTFLVCLSALLTWGFAPRLYMGFGLYPPWVVFQVGISRLLLNVRTSQIFATREQDAGGEDTYLERETSLRDIISPHGRGINRTSCIVASHDSLNNERSRRDEETGTESYFPSISKKHDGGKEGSGSQDGGDHRDSVVEREIRRIHPNAGSLRTRFWWLSRGLEITDIHIDVMQADNPEDSEWGESSGGVKLSRLGRLDEYL